MSKFPSVWDAIEEDPAQAEVMKIRSELIRRIGKHIEKAGWSPAEAASRCRVTEVRLAEFLSGKVDSFRIEELVRIASGAGLRVRIEVVAQG